MDDVAAALGHLGVEGLPVTQAERRERPADEADGVWLVDAAALARATLPDGARLPGLPGLPGFPGARVVVGGQEPELAAAPGVYAVVARPVDAAVLGAALRVARCRGGEHGALRRQVADLERRLEERKLVERAKGLVIRRLGLDEEGAMRWLQGRARDQRQPLAAVAKAVIDAAGPAGAARPR